MQEEVTSKTITFAVRTGKMTASVLLKVLKAYLNSQSHKKSIKKQERQRKKIAEKEQKKYTGKTTVKELAKQNAGITNIEITYKNIRSFERSARKYGINYALKKDKSQDPPVYLVFFKGRDQDALTQAFRDYTNRELRKANKKSIYKRLAKYRAVVAGLKRDKDKNRKQELSL